MCACMHALVRVWVYMHLCYGMHVEVRGQLARVYSLPTVGVQEAGPPVTCWRHLLSEVSCWLTLSLPPPSTPSLLH